MFKNLFLLLFIGLAPGIAQGATIVWGAAIDNGLSLQDGSNLPAGNLVRIGTFDFADESQIVANANHIAFLNAHFKEIHFGHIGDGFSGATAEHFRQQRDDVNTGPSGLDNAGFQMYIWVFASTDNSSTATSIDTAFQHGIFAVSLLVDPDWAVPQDGVIPGVTDVDLTNLTNGASLSGGARVLIGSFPNGSSEMSLAPNFGLAVPEPSTTLFALCGGMALLFRRCRLA